MEKLKCFPFSYVPFTSDIIVDIANVYPAIYWCRAIQNEFYRLVRYSFRYFISTNRQPWFTRAQGAWLMGIYLAYVLLQYTLTGTVHAG